MSMQNQIVQNINVHINHFNDRLTSVPGSDRHKAKQARSLD